MRRFLVVLIGVLALVSSAQAADLRLQGQPQLRVQLAVSDAPTQIEFQTDFHANASGPAYLKALPSTGNSVFRNGTEDAGWWTHAILERDGEVLGEAGTNGTIVATLGPIETGLNYTLRLLVNVPPEAIGEPGEHKLAYALAVQLGANGGGSGGSLDPSVSVLPRLQVVEAEPEEQSSGFGAAFSWDPQWLLPLGLVAAVGALTVVRLARNRKGGA